MDDCWQTHTDALRNQLKSHSLKGVFYVIGDFVGREVNGFRFSSWEDLTLIASDGNEIGSHSCTHRGAGLNTFSKLHRFGNLLWNNGISRSVPRAINAIKSRDEEYDVEHLSQEDEIHNSKLKIEKEIRTECKSYSYPGGGCTSELKQLISKSGYSSARTGYTGFNKFNSLDHFALLVQSWDKSVDSKLANSWVDKAIIDNLWLIEVFHTIDKLDYYYNASSSELNSHLEYVLSRSREIENLNVSEVV